MTKKLAVKKTLNVIANVVFYLIIALCVFYAIILFTSQNKNKLNPIFGHSLVIITSNSMNNSGFEVGDITVVKNSRVNNVKVGDVIAFYNYDYNIKNLPLTYKTLEEYGTLKKNRNFGSDKKEINFQVKNGTNIWFHEIIDIRVDENETLWFKTKGSSNPEADVNWIKESCVLGVNVASKTTVNVLTFVFGPWGVVLFVELPCAIIFVYLINLLINEITIYLKQKKERKKQKIVLTHPIIKKQFAELKGAAKKLKLTSVNS